MSSSGYVMLIGDHWAGRSVGFLVVEIITGLVLLSCLFFVRRFQWSFGGSTDRFRTIGFIIAIISAVLYFILDLTTEGEAEGDAIVSFQYYLIFIFTELFFRTAELAILIVVARSVHLLAFNDFANRAAHRGVRFAYFLMIGVVMVVSITTYSLFTAYYAYYSNAIWASNLVTPTIDFLVAYGSVYSATAMYMFGISIIGVLRQRSKLSLLMVIVALTLLLRAIFYTLDVIMEYFSPNPDVVDNVDWAISYLYDILSIGIYTGIAGFAVMSGYSSPIHKTDSTVELDASPRPYVSLP